MPGWSSLDPRYDDDDGGNGYDYDDSNDYDSNEDDVDDDGDGEDDDDDDWCQCDAAMIRSFFTFDVFLTLDSTLICTLCVAMIIIMILQWWSW